jgi:hypothetical protein
VVSGRCSVFGVRFSDRSRDREGAGDDLFEQNVVISVSVLSTFYFLESTFYGRDAIARSPPMGARGGLSVTADGFGLTSVTTRLNFPA